jgi:hypothetical protein
VEQHHQYHRRQIFMFRHQKFLSRHANGLI